MYKIMLIDDDVPMLKYLQQLIDWKQLELNIAAETYSSVKALQIFKDVLPDIVITDIGLPQMNGLELAAEFIRMKPNVRIIFLTCHEDFHYAKLALKSGADDYLIKDELTAEQLEHSLSKSLKLLQVAELKLEQISYREDLSRNMDVLKKSFFQQMLQSTDEGSLHSYAKRLGIRWDYPTFMLGFAYISYSTLVPQYDFKDIDLIRYGIYNIAGEFARNYDGITVFNDKEYLVILLNYRYSLKLNVQQYIQGFITELHNKCFQFLKVRIRFIWDPSRLELATLGSSYHNMLRQKYSQYYSEPPMVTWLLPENATLYYSISGLFEQEESDFIRAVRENDASLLEKALDSMTEKAWKKQIEPIQIIQDCTKRLYHMELQYARNGVIEHFYACLQSTLTLSDTIGLLRWKLLQLMNSQHALDETANKILKLEIIDQFIKLHLTENITSIDVANHLFLNPSYFTRYFKRIAGENFTEYVHRFKIKIASQMLKNSADSTEMIALKLGYSDRTYFSKVFKKFIGMTPSEYKSK